MVLRNNSDAATDEERARLQSVGVFHLGEFVNAIRHGSLVMRLPDSELASLPTLLLGGVEGAIAVMASLPQDLYALLDKLLTAMQKASSWGAGAPLFIGPVITCTCITAGCPPSAPYHRPRFVATHAQPSPSPRVPVQVVKGVGGLDHATWRSFRDERRSEACRNFIDGDLVEGFLDLSPEQAAAVVGHMGPGHSVEDITRRVEELQRLH